MLLIEIRTRGEIRGAVVVLDTDQTSCGVGIGTVFLKPLEGLALFVIFSALIIVALFC